MKKLLLIAILLLTIPAISFAENVTLIWDANSESDLAGYKLYQSRASGTYDKNLVRATIKAGTEIVVLDINPEGSFYWVLTAYDTNGLESEFSNEVNLNFDAVPPEAPGNLKEAVQAVRISQEAWKVVSVSSECVIRDFLGKYAFDGDLSTRWQSNVEGTTPRFDHPHKIVIDLGAEHLIGGLYYQGRQDEKWHGAVKKYEFRVSTDQILWVQVASGELEKVRTEQFVSFSPVKAQYVEFITLSSVDNDRYGGIAELNLMGR